MSNILDIKYNDYMNNSLLLILILIVSLLDANSQSNINYKDFIRSDGVYMFDNGQDTFITNNDTALWIMSYQMIEEMGWWVNPDKSFPCAPDSLPFLPGSQLISIILFDSSLSYGVTGGGVCRDKESLRKDVSYIRNLKDSAKFAKNADTELIIHSIIIEQDSIFFTCGTHPNFTEQFDGKIYQDSLVILRYYLIDPSTKNTFNANRVYYFYPFSEIYSKDWIYTYKKRKGIYE